MNHNFGLSSSTILIACFASIMLFRALSLFGSYPFGPPPQFAPIDATENPSQGGEAHKISGE